jgi:hypothetical protein
MGRRATKQDHVTITEFILTCGVFEINPATRYIADQKGLKAAIAKQREIVDSPSPNVDEGLSTESNLAIFDAWNPAQIQPEPDTDFLGS